MENTTEQINKILDDAGVVTIPTTDPCPERTAYMAHLECENKDEEWGKLRKELQLNYVINFHKYFAVKFPHLLFEIGEDKIYWNYKEVDGTYEQMNFTMVRSLLLNLLIEEDLTSKATEGTAKVILGKYRSVFIDNGVSLDSFTNDDKWLHVNNGWINTETLVLETHTPARLSLFKMEVDYEEGATCPLYNKFLDVDCRQPKDQVRVIDQYSGYLLTSNISLQKMLIMEGRPGCGKSTMPEIWMDILGRKATTMKLAALEPSNIRFIGDSLANKTLCWFDEANPKTRNINEFFMGLITDKVIKVERKGLNNIEFVKNNLKLILSLNELPDHMPEGMKRRNRHLLFTHSFTDHGEDDPQFLNKVLSNEKSGVFNRMLKGLADLRKMGGMTMIAGEAERQHAYDLVTDDFSAFLDEHFVPSGDTDVRYTLKQVRDSFVSEFPKSYNKGLSIQAFNKKLKGSKLTAFKHIEQGKSRDNRGWVGLKLKDGHTFSKDSFEPIKTEVEIEDEAF